VRGLDHFGYDKVHVVGHDWGALIAYMLASYAPARVLTVTGLAMPRAFSSTVMLNPMQAWYSRYMLFFQLRHISEWIVSASDYAYIDHLWERWSPDTNWTGHWALENAKDVFRLGSPHTLQAALSYYRDNIASFALPSAIISARAAQNKALFISSMRQLHVPTQVLFGVNDGCMHSRTYPDASHPFAQLPETMYRQQSVAGAGHFLHLEQPHLISERILAWMTLKRQ